MAWDEMEMRVLDSLTKSNGIHALASVDLFHEITSNTKTPQIRRLGRLEILSLIHI